MDVIMDIGAILQSLPHRYPFLLIDRVVQFEPGKNITCIKNVTFNEPYFGGHFPGIPVMPGVLQLEVMAQASALCHVETMRLSGMDASSKLFMFTHVKSAKFSRPVTPGDTITVRSSVLKSSSRLAGYSCFCFVEEKMVSESEIYATIVDKQ